MAIDRAGGGGIWGPLAAFSDGYANDLVRTGYAPVSVRLQMKSLADLSDWLLKQGMVAVGLTMSLTGLGRFLVVPGNAGG